jgi:hypothetical protein
MGDEFLDPQPPLIPVRRFSQYLSECMQHDDQVALIPELIVRKSAHYS